MKKIYLLISLCLITFLTSSCLQNTYPRGVDFNKAEFEKQKEKWLASGIDNYKFKYSFGNYMPDYIVGTVTVNETESKADVYYAEGGTHENPYGEKVPDDSQYYFTNIEVIFDALYAEYERALKSVKAGDYDYIIIECNYNEEYGYPESISNPGYGGRLYKEDKSGELAGYQNWDYCFYMDDFEAFELN